MHEKRCTKCGLMKPLDEFNRRAKSADGRRTVCKLCDREAARERYATKAKTTKPKATGPKAGRQRPQNPAVCLRDPTGTYAGEFTRMDFAMTLQAGYWPEGSEWDVSPTYHGKPVRWRVTGTEAVEVGGRRVLTAGGRHDRPVLRVKR